VAATVGGAAVGDHLVDQAAQQRLAALVAERRILPQSRQPAARLQKGGAQVRADRVGPAALGLTPGELPPPDAKHPTPKEH